MTIPDALLAAIIADPDDNLPRLAYADWLEEFGTPSEVARATFIRDQVHHRPGSKDFDLLDVHLEEWLPHFGRHAARRATRHKFPARRPFALADGGIAGLQVRHDSPTDLTTTNCIW